MKIGFVSDTHFGYKRFEEDAAIQGKTAILDAASKADILLLGGDIFDKKDPSLETVAFVVSVLKEAKSILDAKCYQNNILAIAGTHELSPKNILNPIGFLEHLSLVKVLSSTPVIFEEKNEQTSKQKIAFFGLNGIPEELTKTAFEKFDALALKGALNIFVFHQTLKEFIPNSSDELASIEDLPRGFDLYLCGHIHSRREYLNGKLQIPGSTVITQLKEEEQAPKGYLLIDTNDLKIDFIKIPTRPFIIKKLSFKDTSSIEIREAIKSEINIIKNKFKEQKPILKLVLEGNLKKGLNQIQLDNLDYGFFVEIENKLEGLDIVQEIESIKKEHQSDLNPEQIGLNFFFELAKEYGFSDSEADEVFRKFLNYRK